jgi:hypothetical protein
MNARGRRRSSYDGGFPNEAQGWEAPPPAIGGDREKFFLEVGCVLGSDQRACRVRDALAQVGRHAARVGWRDVPQEVANIVVCALLLTDTMLI